MTEPHPHPYDDDDEEEQEEEVIMSWGTAGVNLVIR
jgi:hypothetical protein